MSNCMKYSTWVITVNKTEVTTITKKKNFTYYIQSRSKGHISVLSVAFEAFNHNLEDNVCNRRENYGSEFLKTD